MRWQEEAVRLKLEERLSWTELYAEIQKKNPGISENSIRHAVRASAQYKAREKRDFEQSSIQYKADGEIVSEKFITLRDGDELTPSRILEAHGLKPYDWEVVSYKNNLWNTQLKGGSKQISYQSKLTAKPRTDGVDVAEIEQMFHRLTKDKFKLPKVSHQQGSMMAEVNIADLHLGKLCWHGDTPENYDYKIAQQVFYQIIAEIEQELRGKPIEKILFVWANDFFNSDNDEKTTTAGTRQDTDIRVKKMLNVGIEMLVNALRTFKEIAPVHTFYTPSNHDELMAYAALKAVEAMFFDDPKVSVDIDAYPRKYIKYGNTLLGFTHGDKENDRGSKEKASRLASLMPIEAADLWGQVRFREMHTAHLHSEQMIQEINGVLVRRISSPTAADTYHTTHAYLGAVRKAQVFLYDRERGLVQTINTPV